MAATWTKVTLLVLAFATTCTALSQKGSAPQPSNFLGLTNEYFDADGNATRDLFLVSSDLDEKIRDLTQFEEDMDAETDLLYVMGGTRTEENLEEKIAQFEDTYSSINYEDPDYEEIIVIQADSNLDDATEIKFSEYSSELQSGATADEVFG